ncbi:MAG: DUF4870 domain-containing protein [Lysobacteraceae bacterium]
MTDFNDLTSPPPMPEGVPTAEEKQWAMFAHLSALVGGLLGGWGFFIGPLVIWMMKKDTMPFVSDQAKEALNFNITVTAIFVILWIFGFMTLGVGFLIAMPIMFILGLAALILVIMAGMKANEGVAYRYPFAVRMIK